MWGHRGDMGECCGNTGGMGAVAKRDRGDKGNGDATGTGRDTEDNGHHEEGGLGKRGDTRTTGMGPVGTRGHEDYGDDGDTEDYEETATMRTKPDHGNKGTPGTLAQRGGNTRDHGDRKTVGTWAQGHLRMETGGVTSTAGLKYTRGHRDHGARRGRRRHAGPGHGKSRAGHLPPLLRATSLPSAG